MLKIFLQFLHKYRLDHIVSHFIEESFVLFLFILETKEFPEDDEGIETVGEEGDVFCGIRRKKGLDIS